MIKYIKQQILDIDFRLNELLLKGANDEELVNEKRRLENELRRLEAAAST